MSYSYDSIVIYGVKICNKKTSKIVKAFDHDYPPNFNVDPVSGKPLYKTEYINSINICEIYEICEDTKDCDIIPASFESGEYIIGKVLSIVDKYSRSNQCKELGFPSKYIMDTTIAVNTIKIIKDLGFNPDEMKLYHVYRIM